MHQDGVKGPFPASLASLHPQLHTAIQLFRHYLLKILSSPHWINLVSFSKINGVVYFWTFILFHWCVFYSYNSVLFFLIILLICFLFPPMIYSLTYALFGGFLLYIQPIWGFLDVTIGEGTGDPLQYSFLENPMDGGAWWAAVHGVAKSWTRLCDFTFTFHFHALEKEMATHSSVLAWRIPGTGEPGGLPSMGLHRVGHDWFDLTAAADFTILLVHTTLVREHILYVSALWNYTDLFLWPIITLPW